MAETTEVLAQVSPSAASLTTLYTVPAGSKVVGKVHWCNRSSTPTSVRVSVQVNGEADAVKQYLRYDLPLPANDADKLGPIALAAGDIVKVYATDATVSFTLEGIRRT